MAISEADVRGFRQQRAYRSLVPTPPGVPVATKNELYAYAAQHIGTNAAVTCLEFGVANGDSLARFSGLFTNPAARFFGFDSFHGLPEDWNVGNSGIIPRGAFNRDGRAPATGDVRISFVPGWFQNEVPPFLAAQARELREPILVHFDADLYSSTSFLLAALWFHVPAYHFIMDDFSEDDMIALRDFLAAFPARIEWLGHHVNGAGLAVQVFGKLQRAEFVPGR